MATGLFQSLSNAFKGTPSSQASGNSSPSNVQTFDNQGQPVTQSTGQAPNANNNPAATGSAPSTPSSSAQPDSQSGLDIEALLFAPEPAAAATPGTQPTAPAAPAELAPGLTPQQLLQNLSAVNYTSVVPQESIEAALGGDAEAFSKIISTVAQLSAAVAVKQSIDSSRALLDDRFKSFDSSLDSRISESKYSEILADPQYSNPFIRPMAENLITRLRAKDASMTPQQIKEVLPKLIEHSMKQFSQTTQGVQNPQGTVVTPGASVPREVNFDEVFQS